ncbi:MAG: hypothetical protein KBC38_03540 [Candidatus Pacebacteria bacterium]|nr:hypothetical protein [Candidatus Paceibacterota bacterium]MBP9840129.1 hypothetical protein [Candidatus Paceibacterota bacterium]
MKKILYAAALLATFAAAGCTEQERVKAFGGTMTLEIPACVKLVNMTWKETNLWYLTRPLKAGEVTETHSFNESSSFGTFEGTIHVVERRDKTCP